MVTLGKIDGWRAFEVKYLIFCRSIFVLKTFFVGRELNWQYLTEDERYKSPTLKVSIKTCFVLSAAEFFVFISLRCFQEKQVEPVL